MNNCAFYLEINSIRYTSDVLSLNLLKLKILTFITCLVPRFSHLTYIFEKCVRYAFPLLFIECIRFSILSLLFSQLLHMKIIFSCIYTTHRASIGFTYKNIVTRSLHIVVKHKHKIVFTPYRFLNVHNLYDGSIVL